MAKRTRRNRSTSQPPLPDLPPNVRLSVEPDRLEIVYACPNRIGGLFPLFFGILWTTVIVFGSIQEFQKGATWSLAFFIPFYLVSLFLLGVAARNYFHRERLLIDGNGLDWRLSAIVTIYQRRIPWDQLVGINDGCRYGGNPLIGGWGVEVETVEKTFYLFLDMDFQEEGKILKRQLKKFIGGYRKLHAPAEPKRSGESKRRRRESLCINETAESLEIEGVPEARHEVRIGSIVWMTGWTIGCIVLPFCMLPPKGDMTLGIALVLIAVFWASWLFAIPMLLMMNWRWESLKIGNDGLEYRVFLRLPFLSLPIRSRHVPLDDLGPAEPYRVVNGSYVETGIQFPNTGRRLRCFKTQCDTCHALSFLDAVNNRLTLCGVTEKSRFKSKTEDHLEIGPRESRWAYSQDGAFRTFSRPGHVSTRTLAVYTFACVFMGGIVSLMVFFIARMWIEGKEPLLLRVMPAVIVAPFVPLTALVLFGMLLAYMQCFCHYKITIDGFGIRYRRSWLGIGWSRFWPLTDFAKVTVKRRTTKIRIMDTLINPERSDTPDGTTNPYPFAVHLMDADDKPLGMIPDLLVSVNFNIEAM